MQSGILDWLWTLLGRKPRGGRSAARPHSAPAASTPELGEGPELPGVFIGWREMVDARTRIGGYLLEPRPADPGGRMEVSQLLLALRNDGVARIAEKRLLVLPVTRGLWHEAGPEELAWPNLHLAPGTPADREALMPLLRQAGRKVALFVAHGLLDGDIPDADLLLVDFRGAELAAIEDFVRRHRNGGAGAKLVATGIQSWAEHKLAVSLGFDFSVGDFVTTLDPAEPAEAISGSRLVIMELLKLVRDEAPLDAIAAQAKRDPAIMLNLLKVANSPIFGLGNQVASLDAALLVLGRDPLYRWLSLALFKVGKDRERDQTLLVLALCRAHFLEALPAVGQSAIRNDLFLLGLVSVLDSLLGRSAQDVASQVPMPESVASALVRSEGPYARHLALAMAMERCRLVQAFAIAGHLGLDTGHVIDCYARAVAASTAELGES